MVNFFRSLFSECWNYNRLFELEVKRAENNLSNLEKNEYDSLEHLHHDEEPGLTKILAALLVIFDRPVLTYQTLRAYHQNRGMKFS